MSLPGGPLLLVALSLLTSGPAFGQSEPVETRIPSGWELSATLAFMRNVPFIDETAFVPTEGPVLCRFEEAVTETGSAQTFTNTYHFYRAAVSGGYLHLRFVETHRMEAPAANASALIPSLPATTVADTAQAIAVIGSAPPEAAPRDGVSPVVRWLLDHREPLLASEAGTIARRLHYAEGRLRTESYAQPRVSYLEANGSVTEVRIYGLESLLAMPEDTASPESTGKPVRNRVLKLSIAPSGNVVVDLADLSSSEPR